MHTATNRGLRAIVVGILASAVVIGIEWYWAHDLVWVVARHWIALTDIAGDQAPTALSDLGNAGELMGGASALFAGLACAGIAIAIYLQVDARRAADAHAATLVAQYARQAFEPLFFRLLELLRSQMNGARFGVAAEELLKARQIIATPESGDAKVDRLVERYSSLYRDNENQLAPYFGALHQVIKLVDRSGLASDEKLDYVDILRSLLSGDEWLMIAVHCLTNDGTELKTLVEKSGLLRHAPHAKDGSIGLANELAGLRFASTETMSRQQRRGSDSLVD